MVRDGKECVPNWAGLPGRVKRSFVKILEHCMAVMRVQSTACLENTCIRTKHYEIKKTCSPPHYMFVCFLVHSLLQLIFPFSFQKEWTCFFSPSFVPSFKKGNAYFLIYHIQIVIVRKCNVSKTWILFQPCAYSYPMQPFTALKILSIHF